MSITKQTRYLASGFIPINETLKTKTIPCAAVNIVKGDALHADGSGYATNGVTTFTGKFLGVAASPMNNTVANTLSGATGVAGTANCEFYPFDPETAYIVPVSNALITQAAVGTYVAITAAGTVSTGVHVSEGYAFFVEEIDVSAAAIVGNQYGYAIGRFRSLGVQAQA